MKISNDWLEEKSACVEGVEWFNNQSETDSLKVLNKLIAEDKLDWANWLICRLFDYKQRVQYAVYAAEQVVDIFEEARPDDKRPRQAIEAARKCIDNPSEENKKAASAFAFATAAFASASAAISAYAAAYAAATNAYAAAFAYVSATNASAFAYSAASTRKEMQLKIINYGIGLLE